MRENSIHVIRFLVALLCRTYCRELVRKMTKSRFADYVFFVGFCYNNSFDYFWAKRIVVFKQNQYFMKKRYCHIFLFALLLAFNVDVFATSTVGRVFDEWNISASVSPVNSDDRLVFIDPKNHVVVAQIEGTYDASGIINGHYYVDLGLSVKWATCNVGASRPEASGSKFAWGEVATKGDYNWDNYKWDKDDSGYSGGYALTKYCSNPDYGYCIYESEYYWEDDVYFSDDLTTLTTADDVAYKTWGSQWRMPSKKQLEELVDRCSWKWTSQNGYLGFKVTGPNGKSIFMPAEHFFEKNGNVSYSSEVHYWSLSLNEETCKKAYALEMDEYWDEPYVTVTDYDRCYGLFIRPVTQ